MDMPFTFESAAARHAHGTMSLERLTMLKNIFDSVCDEAAIPRGRQGRPRCACRKNPGGGRNHPVGNDAGAHRHADGHGRAGLAQGGSISRPQQPQWSINLRLAEPEAVAAIVINHFDGLESFRDLPRDGRCVSDMWF